MKFNVRMLAFNQDDSVIREVDVPDDKIHGNDGDLDEIYYYGQNDFQPQQVCSVSVGDVIEYENKRFVVQSFGFKEITKEQYEEYLNVPQRDRYFYKFGT